MCCHLESFNECTWFQPGAVVIRCRKHVLIFSHHKGTQKVLLDSPPLPAKEMRTCAVEMGHNKTCSSWRQVLGKPNLNAKGEM